MELTRTPTEVQQGVKVWKTGDGIACMRIHYSAEPNWNDPLWLEAVSNGYQGGTAGRAWQREMEIDFTSWAGDPVYSMFDTKSVREVAHMRHLPLLRGWDFGYRHPAVTFHQYNKSRGEMITLDELYPVTLKDGGMTTVELVDFVMRYTADHFGIPAPTQGQPDHVVDCVDPAGSQKSDKSHFSDVEIMSARGLRPQFSVVGRKSRIQRLRYFVENARRYAIHPRCGNTIKALQGGYRYVEKGETADPEMPDTSKKVQEEPYIHLMDSMEYTAAIALPDAAMPVPKATPLNVVPSLPGNGNLAEVVLAMTPEQRQRIDWGVGSTMYADYEDDDPWYR